MNPIIASVEKTYIKKNPPKFDIGDKVKVHMRIVEGEKERIQVVEGIVIRKRGSGTSETFTVRKESHGTALERIFPIHSPRVEKVEVVRHNKVRRAKLYYLRDRSGKSARLTEKFISASKAEKAEAEEPAVEAPEKEAE
ncbi:MAG: 50S ribosomal protein L19 [Nitrospinota bacterium]|nr:50S ribosomal protein L19 [Nitrospinota bacterium]